MQVLQETVITLFAALIALAMFVTFGLCYCVYKNKFRNTHPAQEPYYSTISAGSDPNASTRSTLNSATCNEHFTSSTDQEPEYLSLTAPNPSQENIATVANNVVPRTSSLSNLKMTNNASYVSGNPANVHTTQNEAYGLVYNATTSTNMGQDCVKVDDEDITTDIVPGTRSLSDIRTTCNPSYVSSCQYLYDT